MKAAKSWLFAGLALVAAASSASCGHDETSGGSSGKGTIVGSGGSGGAGGGRTIGGSSGAGGATSATKLGRACVTDTECADTNAPGLTCVTSTSTVLGGGAPPKGLCTSTCTADSDCAPLGAGSVCYPFGSNNNAGYCLEGCSFGMPNLGEAKCHTRSEFACDPALLAATNTTCTQTSDCQQSELCISGVCNIVTAACLPSCRGDIDCDAGMYCDQSFLSGVCVAKKPTGKALGEPCTVPPSTGASEPDECLGFCQADTANSNKGHCAATCGLGNQCAWNASSKKYDGLCLYASALTSSTGDTGDFGFCTPACNCAADCQDSALDCELLQGQMLPTDTFRGAGLCFAPSATSQAFNQCTGEAGAGGVGGAGGAGGASGAGGESSAGSPAGGVGGAP